MKINPPLYLDSLAGAVLEIRPAPAGHRLGAGRVTDEDGDLFEPDNEDIILLSNIAALPDPTFAVRLR